MKCANYFGSYKNMIALPIPDHMLKINGGFYSQKTHVYIDLCLVEEIQMLWANKINTKDCCCGHNILRGHFLVDEKDTDKMIEMGYREDKGLFNNFPEHKGLTRKWFAKSKHTDQEREVI